MRTRSPKISKRVGGVLADMAGMRSVGVVEEQPAAGLVKIAKPVGVVAALIPTTGPDATPPVKTLFALKGAQRHHLRAASAHPAHHRSSRGIHAGGM